MGPAGAASSAPPPGQPAAVDAVMPTQLDRWTQQAIVERAEQHLHELDRRSNNCALGRTAELRAFVRDLPHLLTEAVRRDEAR